MLKHEGSDREKHIVEDVPAIQDAINRNASLVYPVVIGRVSEQDVLSDDNQRIVAAGQEITRSIAEAAYQCGRLYELWMAAGAGEENGGPGAGGSAEEISPDSQPSTISSHAADLGSAPGRSEGPRLTDSLERSYVDGERSLQDRLSESAAGGVTQGVDAETAESKDWPLQDQQLDDADQGKRRAAISEFSSGALRQGINRNPDLVYPVVVGRFSDRELCDPSGVVIVHRGEEITRGNAEAARQSEMLYELWVAAQPTLLDALSRESEVILPDLETPEETPEMEQVSVEPAAGEIHNKVKDSTASSVVMESMPEVEAVNTEPLVSLSTEEPLSDIVPEAEVELVEAAAETLPRPKGDEPEPTPAGFFGAEQRVWMEQNSELPGDGLPGDVEGEFHSTDAPPPVLKVELNWGPSEGASSYNVKRSTVSGGPYALLASDVRECHYVDLTVVNGTTYYYVVSAVSESGESPDSSEIVATPIAPPAAPVGLTAAAGNARVTLLWQASVGASGYNIRRSLTRGGPYTTLAAGVSNTSFADETAANGNTYYYLVSAVNSGGESPLFAETSARPLAPPDVPETMEAWPGNGQVRLFWKASPLATSYNIRRAMAANGPFNILATGVISPRYVDMAVRNGLMYYYQVSAVNAGGESSKMVEASARPLEPPGPPVEVSAQSGNAQVSLSWKPSAGAVSYNVRRAVTQGGPYTTVATPVIGTSYVDVTVSNGRTYYYMVTGVNPGGESAASNEVSVRPVAPPAPPSGLVGTPGNAKATLQWSASAGAISYSVRRSNEMSGPYELLATGIGHTFFVDTTAHNDVAYYYVVTSVGPGGESMHSTEVIVTPVEPPPAPKSLTASPGNALVTLQWVPSPNALSYNVKRALARGGPYIVVIAETPGTSFVDRTVRNGATCYYVVSALNPGGESMDSPEASARPVAPPSSPNGVMALPGNSQILLTWNPSTGATSYNIRRSLMAGGPYTSLATNVNATTFTDVTVSNGNTYYYLISGVSAGGEGPAAAETHATPLPPPGMVGGLTAIPGNGFVCLFWNEAAGSLSYTIKRSTSRDGSYSILATGVMSTSYTDTAVDNGQMYHYIVTGLNSGGESPACADASARPVAPPQPPAGISAAPGNMRVTLSWIPSTGAVSYTIQRSTTPGGPFTIVATPVTSTSYTDIGLTNGVIYYYIVTAVNAGGESGCSSEVTGRPVAPPPAPIGLVVSVGNTRCSLAWAAVVAANSYNIKRSTAMGGPYTTIATNVTAITYLDTLVANGVTYYYLVTAVNAGGESGNSSEVSGCPVAAPSHCPQVTAMPGSNQVTLTWNLLREASGFNVKRANQPGGPYQAIALNVEGTSYVDKTPINGVVYYYVVSAVNPGGESGNSVEVSAIPIPAPHAPTGLTAISGNNQVTLRWNLSPGAVGYNVKRGSMQGGPYSVLARGISTASCTDTTAVNGEVYFYVVSGVNVGGESGDTAEVVGEPVAPPSAPSSVTAAAGNAQVTLMWAASPSAVTYNIKRSVSVNGPYAMIASGVKGTSYLDLDVRNGQSYYYVLSAVNAGGESGNSPEASGAPVSPPACPSDLVAVAGNGCVSLSWSVSRGAASYNIKRSTVRGGSYTVVAVGVLATTYIDTSVENGTEYAYVVSAVNVGGESGHTVEAIAEPASPPEPPTLLSAGLAGRASGPEWPAPPLIASPVFPASESSVVVDSKSVSHEVELAPGTLEQGSGEPQAQTQGKVVPSDGQAVMEQSMGDLSPVSNAVESDSVISYSQSGAAPDAPKIIPAPVRGVNAVVISDVPEPSVPVSSAIGEEPPAGQGDTQESLTPVVPETPEATSSVAEEADTDVGVESVMPGETGRQSSNTAVVPLEVRPDGSQALTELLRRNEELLLPLTLGKFATEDVRDESGNVIVALGTKITLAEVEKARTAGKLYELWMAAQTDPSEER